MTEVLPTNEARARLNQIAAGFDHDPEAAPVVFGSHRRAQGVIVSWQLWQRIAPAVEDALDTELARQRLDEAGGERLSHEQLLEALDHLEPDEQAAVLALIEGATKSAKQQSAETCHRLNPR